MQRIDDMIVGGDVTGDITVILDSSSGHLGATVWPCRINGDLLGNLEVGADIRKLDIRGSFGNPGGAARTMRAYGDIRNLAIGEVLDGAIIEARDASSNLTSIQTFVVDDQWGASGDMDGELIANVVEVLDGGGIPLIDIKGDLNGAIDLASAFDARMLIGGSFGADAEINLPEDGLVGQISFNTADGSATWAGDLVIDSVTYAEEYAALPSVIGGGAAGLAPFNAIHDETANRGSPGYVFITGIDIYDLELNCYDYPFDGEVIFHLYGPVSIESGTGAPAKVQVRTGPTTWTDAFDIEAEIVSITGSRGLKFVRKDGSGNPIAWPQTVGEYRIVPKEDRIVSVDVAGTPTADFEYYIELADGCAPLLLSAFDLNSDDTLCPADIACWTGNPVDLNNDSVADGDDATLLINAVNAYNN